jgi:hypothetical protein
MFHSISGMRVYQCPEAPELNSREHLHPGSTERGIKIRHLVCEFRFGGEPRIRDYHSVSAAACRSGNRPADRAIRERGPGTIPSSHLGGIGLDLKRGRGGRPSSAAVLTVRYAGKINLG